MKKIYIFILFLLSINFIFSQGNFQFLTNKKKISIPFQVGNNLVIIPVELNGVKLNFLLDTGVESTILFSLEEADSISFNSLEKIKIKGLGTGKAIEALHSKKNDLRINGFVDDKHEVFIILDQEVNFSSQVGIPVHGIIGYNFFKDHFVEINYKAKKVVVYRNIDDYPKSRLKSFEEIPISLEFEKPYVFADILLNEKNIKAKLLVDTGGSDAIWLFEDGEVIKSPNDYFIDFLGKGFSGDIHGKRSRIKKMNIGNKEINLPTISFPDKESLQNASFVKDRKGSVGSEILRRFITIYDYKNGRMFFKKNNDFEDPFNYNMSGMEVQHSGLQWIKEEVQFKTNLLSAVKDEVSVYESGRQNNLKYQFALKPVYEITSVRKSSPADLAGIKKGDVIQSINGKYSFKYKLQDIISLMQSEEGKWIKLEVERNGVVLKTKFQLKKIL